jgi:hypothetical protein
MYDPSARRSGKEDDVRTMMRVTIPVAAGNAAIKNNRLPQVMADAMARMQPEAAYFTADKGSRTAYFFVDLKDQSQTLFSRSRSFRNSRRASSSCQ